MNLPLRAAQVLVDAAWRMTRPREKALAPISTSTPGSGGWMSLIREPFTGAWQRNMELRVETVLTYFAVFRCISLISSDIAKMRMRLVEQGADLIWREVDRNSPHWPVLRRPNRYQNSIQFFRHWMESKLIHGNSYVFKERDDRNVVTSLHVLNPELVTVLVAPDGAVIYELRPDNLSRSLQSTIKVPAREIIHDRWNTIYHPLVGVSPITAAGPAAVQGLKIQENSVNFFSNGSKASGVILIPTGISKDQAREIARTWDERPAGTTAVLTGGATYTPLTMSATDSQLIEQGLMTARTVASAFGVPAYKIGVGDPPSYNNIEALDAGYYSQCLQSHIEDIEKCLDDGLELKNGLGTEFDLTDLLRMDTSTKVKAAADAIGSGAMAPNEARQRYFDLGPVEGGESPYLQQQNFSLAALHRRDQQSNPVTPGFGEPPTEETGEDVNEPSSDAGGEEERERTVIDFEQAVAAIERAARDYDRRSA